MDSLLEDEIEALLRGRPIPYLMKHFGVDRITPEIQRKAFTVDRPTLLAYVESRPTNIDVYGPSHGFSIHQRDGKWILIEQDERSGPIESEYATQAAARKFLVDYILRHTYTGLDFSKHPVESIVPPYTPPPPLWRRFWLRLTGHQAASQ